MPLLLLLPTEILLEIFSYLTAFELYSSVLIVCRRFRDLSSSNASAGVKKIDDSKWVKWCDWQPEGSIIGWASGPRMTHGSKVFVLRAGNPKDLLLYVALPSMRRLDVAFGGDMDFKSWRAAKPSNLTSLRIECGSASQRRCDELFSGLPVLKYIDLELSTMRDLDIITPIGINVGKTLKMLRLKVRRGDITPTQDLKMFQRLVYVSLEWRIIIRYCESRNFQDIFPPSIEHVRLHLPAIIERADGALFQYDDKSEFIQDLHDRDYHWFRMHKNDSWSPKQCSEWIAKPKPWPGTKYDAYRRRILDPEFSLCNGYYSLPNPFDQALSLPHHIPGTQWVDEALAISHHSALPKRPHGSEDLAERSSRTFRTRLCKKLEK